MADSIMSAILAGQIRFDGGGISRPESEKEMKARKMASFAEEIPCPGGCGSSAWLERAVTSATIDGETRYFRLATCDGTCVREDERRGRPRWEIPAEKPAETVPLVVAATPLPVAASPKKTKSLFWAPPPAPEKPKESADMSETGRYIAEREMVREAIEAVDTNTYKVAKILQISCSNLSTWLSYGRNLSPDKFAPVVDWAREALAGEHAKPDGPIEVACSDSEDLEITPPVEEVRPQTVSSRIEPEVAILAPLLEEAVREKIRSLAGPKSDNNLVVHVTLEWCDAAV